jgi:hypothetical protein
VIHKLSTRLNLDVKVEANLTSKFTQSVDNPVDNFAVRPITPAYEA